MNEYEIFLIYTSHVTDFIQDILFKIGNWNKFNYVTISRNVSEKSIWIFLKRIYIIWYNFFVNKHIEKIWK